MCRGGKTLEVCAPQIELGSAIPVYSCTVIFHSDRGTISFTDRQYHVFYHHQPIPMVNWSGHCLHYTGRSHIVETLTLMCVVYLYSYLLILSGGWDFQRNVGILHFIEASLVLQPAADIPLLRMEVNTPILHLRSPRPHKHTDLI